MLLSLAGHASRMYPCLFLIDNQKACRYNDYRQSGRSSAGRVQASQAWGRGFETRRPLHFPLNNPRAFLSDFLFVQVHPLRLAVSEL